MKELISCMLAALVRRVGLSGRPSRLQKHIAVELARVNRMTLVGR